MSFRSAVPGVMAVIALSLAAAAAGAQPTCLPFGPPVVLCVPPNMPTPSTPVAVRPAPAGVVRPPVAVVPRRPDVRPAGGFARPQPAVPEPAPGGPPRVQVGAPAPPVKITPRSPEPKTPPVGTPKPSQRPANPLVIPLGPTETPKSATPPLTIPPILPGKDDGKTLPPLKLPTSPADSTSFASPLGSRRPFRVDVFPVAGTSDGRPSVRLFNTTGRELSGAIGGEAFRLPPGHWITADVLDAAFTWEIAGEPEQSTAVPAGAGGVELIVRP